MSDRYARLDVHLLHKNTCGRLYDEYGHFGPLAWAALILAAKRHHPAGEFTWTSSLAAWEELLGPRMAAAAPIEFDHFVAILGRLKQVRKTRNRAAGRVQHAVITQYERWQKDSKTYEASVRKSRSRAQKPRDTSVTGAGQTRDESRDLDLELLLPPNPQSQNGKKHPHDCPVCGTRQPSRSALDAHLERSHPTTAATPPADDGIPF